MSAAQMQPEKGRNLIGAGVGIAALIILVVAYVIVLTGYSREGAARSAFVSDKVSAGPDNLEVNIQVASVDPVKGDMTARLTFEAQGALATDENVPAKDVTLLVNSATGKQEHKFEKGKHMNPVEITIPLVGQASDYPFDSHETELWLFVSAAAKEKPEHTNEGAGENSSTSKPPTQASAFEPLPVAVEFFGSIPGLKLKAEKGKDSDVGFTAVEIMVSRSSTVIFFSVFVMILMLCLAAVVVMMMTRFWLGKRKVELTVLGFYGGMLFAFPALRNSQPGVPPLGTYSDYVSFFWAEMLVAISLMTIAMLWVIRRPS